MSESLESLIDAITAEEWLWLLKSASGKCAGPEIKEPSLTRVAQWRGQVMSKVAFIQHLLSIVELYRTQEALKETTVQNCCGPRTGEE